MTAEVRAGHGRQRSQTGGEDQADATTEGSVVCRLRGPRKPSRNIDRKKREVSISISEKIARTHVVFPLPNGSLQITFIGVAPTMSGRRLKMELLHRDRAAGCQFGNVVGDEDVRVLLGYRIFVWLVLLHAITVGNGV